MFDLWTSTRPACGLSYLQLPAARWKDQPLAVTAWAYGFGVLCLLVSSLFYAKTTALYYIPFEVSLLSPATHVYNHLRCTRVHCNIMQVDTETDLRSLCAACPCIIVSCLIPQALYSLTYAVLITSVVCYLCLSWANFNASSTLVAAFWPLQVCNCRECTYNIQYELLVPCN